MPDPRYIASLQSVDDPCCYKDFFEGDTFEIAKQKADESAEKHNRNALVYDRKLMAITYKKEIIRSETKFEKPVVKPAKKTKKIKEKMVKSVSKDAYFE